MKKYTILILASVISLLLVTGCDQPGTGSKKLLIALSKGSPDSSYANYYRWIERIDTAAEGIDMYAMPIDSALVLFRECSGLILTGGTDIHPEYYGKAYDTVRCWPIDDHRDQLEMRLLDSAIAWGIPVLGICRGHQMINVALGGSLVVDIPQDRGTAVIHQCEDYLNCFHPVRLDPASQLAGIAGVKEGVVNSNHHQAADAIAPGLKAVAFTSDGVVEALEWADPAGKTFLLGVQWHPERMELSNPLSDALGRKFLNEVTKLR
jgi:putative glutamine amidotransferase